MFRFFQGKHTLGRSGSFFGLVPLLYMYFTSTGIRNEHWYLHHQIVLKNWSLANVWGSLHPAPA